MPACPPIFVCLWVHTHACMHRSASRTSRGFLSFSSALFPTVYSTAFLPNGSSISVWTWTLNPCSWIPVQIPRSVQLHSNKPRLQRLPSSTDLTPDLTNIDSQPFSASFKTRLQPPSCIPSVNPLDVHSHTHVYCVLCDAIVNISSNDWNERACIHLGQLIRYVRLSDKLLPLPLSLLNLWIYYCSIRSGIVRRG